MTWLRNVLARFHPKVHQDTQVQPSVAATKAVAKAARQTERVNAVMAAHERLAKQVRG